MPSPPWFIETGLGAAIPPHSQASNGGTGLARRQNRPWQRLIAAEHVLPAEAAQTGELPPLPAGLRAALGARGVRALYRHQLEAVAAARAGRHTIVATPTASGKSLCFHLPVLAALAEDPSATAIYLYPTKALSRDQEASLGPLASDAGIDTGVAVYDGDTPGQLRRAIRQRARIVMTNPDMLHSGIMPQHAAWQRLLSGLRYVVVDELHVYRGVFGSHVAHVIERLRRIARFHGAEPTFLGATATIGNPGEHAALLMGVDLARIEVISRSTAPRGERRVLVVNPSAGPTPRGYLKTAVEIVGDLLAARVRTLLFGPSRNAVEIMVKYLRDRFASRPALCEAIVSYRGGYLPEARRRVERGLREGAILGVVATNALELGIDIGQLDAVICAGYPGSVAETWQRFGRAGRRAEASLAVLVASSAPLDQYLATHPDLLFGADNEAARIDPANTEILLQHVKCAAFELPFAIGDRYATLPAGDTEQALDYLAGERVLHRGRDRFHWAASDAFPANHVSLRRIGWDNFVIIDRDSGEALAELDWHSAPSMLHEQAIYQHEGEQYQVERLDYDNHKAFVRKVEPDYFTTALRHRRVGVLDELGRGAVGRAQIAWGEVSVVEKIVGYKKVKFHTHENAGYGEVRLPEIEMHTTSCWLAVAEPCGDLGRAAIVAGLGGFGHALEIVAAVALMCDPRDLGSASDFELGRDGASAAPMIHLFDNIPCGVGLAERIFERAADLLGRAARLVAACPCDNGCPSCVGATEEGRKGATLRLVAALTFDSMALPQVHRPADAGILEPCDSSASDDLVP